MCEKVVGRRVDAELVEMLWEELHTTYRTRRRRKRASWFMRIVAWGIGIFGVMPADRFLDRFATTIRRTIYIPEYPMGGNRDLLGEIARCVHEHVHVTQWSLRFAWRYLTDKIWRARYEAMAFRANIALRYWYAGEWLDIREMAAKLGTNYGCGEAGVELAYHILEDERDRLQLGSISDPLVKSVVIFLGKQGVLPAFSWPYMDR